MSSKLNIRYCDIDKISIKATTGGYDLINNNLLTTSHIAALLMLLFTMTKFQSIIAARSVVDVFIKDGR
jgi:hypothetical protein